jgi:hypothetical protein
MAGRYGPEDADGLDIDVVRDYCMEMSFRSLQDMSDLQPGSIGDHPDAAEVRRVFTDIHDRNLWRAESVSGAGSTLEATILVRERLQTLFRTLDIRVLCDAACGDANWINHITEELDLYLGFDVVEGLIHKNLARYPRTNQLFRVADLTRDVLPRADAILCRDALVHLPYAAGLAAVENFRKSGSTYLIATWFPVVAVNEDPGLGGWWPLNLNASPYNFPPPIHNLREREPNPDDPFNSKSLGVWRLADFDTAPAPRQSPSRRPGRSLLPRRLQRWRRRFGRSAGTPRSGAKQAPD